MLYDVSPEINLEKNTLNFIVQTPQASPYRYEVDQVSGQHYLEDKYCKQSDIWKKFDGSICLPTMTIGYVPKIRDQLGTPQKIIVFGDKKYFAKNFTENFFEAKIIGGLIEQECEYGGCFKRDEWRSRVVLIGVQKQNSKFSNIESVDELKKKIKWDSVVAFLQNGQGKNKIVDNFFPGFRVGITLSREKTLNYLDKKSIFLTNKKLLSMRRSCHRLYDYLYENVYKDSPFEIGLRNAKTYDKQLSLVAKFKKNERSLFHDRFIKAFKDYNREFTTCIDNIYPSNINYDRVKHWFLAYYTALHRVYNSGYSFNCIRNSWERVVSVGSRKRSISIENEFKNCSTRTVVNALTTAIKELEIISSKNYKSYRYIDYDNSSIGTHKKIYAWVPKSNKALECSEKFKIKNKIEVEFFPKDIRWPREKIILKNESLLIK
jgi:hypothetical protein